MKKMLLATALALLITGCSTDVYCSKQTGSSSTKGNHHPSFLRFWNWAEENCRCSRNAAAQKMLLKRNPANIRKWIARFYYLLLGIYTRWKRVCAAYTLHELPIDMGNSICTAH